MTNGRWACTWQGLPIEVEASHRGLRFRGRLLVDGQVLDEEDASATSGPYLCARVLLPGSSHVIDASIGSVPGIPMACKIMVDGRRVGGDDVPSLEPPEPLVWAETRTKGRLRYLLASCGSFGLGAVAAVALIAVMFRGHAPAAMLSGALGAVAAMVVRADSRWQLAERRYQTRLRKLQDAGWAGPEDRGLRRLVRLFLFVLGAFLVVVPAAVTAFVASSVDSLGALVTPTLLLPVGFIGLGLALLAASRQMDPNRAHGDPPVYEPRRQPSENEFPCSACGSPVRLGASHCHDCDQPFVYQEGRPTVPPGWRTPS